MSRVCRVTMNASGRVFPPVAETRRHQTITVKGLFGMTLGHQLLWGSGFLTICLILHVACLALCAVVLPHLDRHLHHLKHPVRTGLLLLITLGVMVFALTLQVWVWAAVYYHFYILNDWNSAIYFSMVTFTSLGYGDIVLGPEVRIFATFGSVTGLLSFGLSTAFLVAVTSNVFKRLGLDHKTGENRRATGAP